MIHTYCSDCNSDIDEEIRHLKLNNSGQVVCDVCYEAKYTKEAITRISREKKINDLLKSKGFIKIFFNI